MSIETRLNRLEMDRHEEFCGCFDRVVVIDRTEDAPGGRQSADPVQCEVCSRPKLLIIVTDEQKESLSEY